GYNLARLTLGNVARLAGDAREALGAHEELLAKAKKNALSDTTWGYNFESKEAQGLAAGVRFPSEASRRALVALEIAVDHAFLEDVAKARSLVDAAVKEFSADDLKPALEKTLDDVGRALELRPAHFQLHYLAAILRRAHGDEARAKDE